MSALAEIAIAVFSFVIEVTIRVALLAVAPLRFIFSSRYRLATRQQWRAHPSQCAAELVGGSLVLILFAGTLTWWLYFFARPEPSPADHSSAESERRARVLEKILDSRKSRPRKD